jgi:hypothetical protein
MTDWVLVAERAYVAAAFVGRAPAIAAATPDRAHALAAAAAIASRFLAVGTPRSFAIIIDAADDAGAAALALTAHLTWFAPRDIRIASTTTGDLDTSVAPGAATTAATGVAALAAATGGRIVSLAEALASDIVNLYSSPALLSPNQLRRGTHVNVLGPLAAARAAAARPAATQLHADFHQLATVVPEAQLPALAAGLVDGRQLDELTIFLADPH